MATKIKDNLSDFRKINEFKKILKEYSVQPGNESSAKILEKVMEIKKIMPPTSSNDDFLKSFFQKRSQLLRTLAEAYVSLKVIEKYPKLDDKLFDLNRVFYINVASSKIIADSATTPADKFVDSLNLSTKQKARGRSSNGKNTRISCKLFCVVNINSVNQVVLASYTRNNPRSYYSRTTTRIKTKVPTVPPNIVSKGYSAVSSYYSNISQAKNDFELDLKELLKNITTPDLEVAWIPGLESLDISTEKMHIVTNKDPALLMRTNTGRYLIATWNIDNEVPFDKYIREFSEGDLKDILKSK